MILNLAPRLSGFALYPVMTLWESLNPIKMGNYFYQFWWIVTRNKPEIKAKQKVQILVQYFHYRRDTENYIVD